MIVHVGSILFEYTGGRARVEAQGATVAAVLDDLDDRYPGLKFRVIDEQEKIRPHIKIFLGSDPVSRLSDRVDETSEMHVLAALSGG